MTDEAGGDEPCVMGGRIDVGKNRPRPVEVGPAYHGEVDTASGAVQQLDAELGLELPDLLRERWLGHVQPLGGAAEVTLLRHRHEVPEMPQIHISPISIDPYIRTSEYRRTGLTSVP